MRLRIFENKKDLISSCPNMGCRQSHVNNSDNNSEDENFKDLNKINEVDSRLPLDARQVFKLKQSWKGIKRKIEEAGVEMFIR